MSRPVDIPNRAGAGAAAEPAKPSPTTASILDALRRDLALSPHEAAQQRARGGAAGGVGARVFAAGTGAAHEEDDDEEAAAADEDHSATAAAAAAATPEHPPPPPDFAPFYTLITDATTPGGGATTHTHPTAVHYLFADDADAPALLTDALVAHLPPVVGPRRGRPQEDEEQEEDVGGANTEEGEEEDHRIVIVDLAADGREVLSVASLSPRWQALSASVAAAPSWRGGGAEGEGQGQAATTGGLMLKIAGSEVVAVGEGGRRGKTGTGAGTGDEVEGLLREFDARLGELDRVLVTAEEEGGGGVGEGHGEVAGGGED